MEVAKGNIPFFEKNLQEVIRRNVRSGRLVYSADPEELARKAQVIFLAEDSAQGLEELVLRLATRRAASRCCRSLRPVAWVRPPKIEKLCKTKG
jgi:UDP-glucose 6-dehydrogenase